MEKKFALYIISLNFIFYYKNKFYKFAKIVNYQMWNIIKYSKYITINEGKLFGEVNGTLKRKGPNPR